MSVDVFDKNVKNYIQNFINLLKTNGIKSTVHLFSSNCCCMINGNCFTTFDMIHYFLRENINKMHFVNPTGTFIVRHGFEDAEILVVLTDLVFLTDVTGNKSSIKHMNLTFTIQISTESITSFIVHLT
jgi:hypothetical protein